MKMNDLPTGGVIPTKENLNPKGFITENDLIPGDILLSPPTPISWKGQAIVKVTGCETSHTAIYCGKDSNGEHIIAHSVDEGIVLITMKKHFIEDKTPLCYVRRHIPESNKDKIVAAAKNFVEMKIPYPNEMFVILGVVLLSKKLSIKKELSEVYHKLVKMACKILIKVIKKRKTGSDVYMMNCSQFALECYEKAGYQIKFDKFVLDYKKNKQPADSASGIDLPVESKNMFTDWEISHEAITKVDEEELSAPEQATQYLGTELTLTDSTDELAGHVFQLITGKEAESANEALAFIKSNEKYFILPDDLLYNTEDFTDVGIIPRSNYDPDAGSFYPST